MAQTRRLLGIAAALVAVSVAGSACSDGGPETVVTPTPEAASETPGKKPKPKKGKSVVALPHPTAMPVPPLVRHTTPQKVDKGGGRDTGSVPRTGNCLKGVGTWDLREEDKAMRASGSCWYYTWSPTDWFGAPAGIEFVPMVWSGRDMGKLGEVKGKTLLGFNEPDLAGQANMSVEEALDLWPQLQKTGMRLGSPSPAWGGDVPGGWLDRFMKGAKDRGLRVDFITLHFYSRHYDTKTAVGELRTYVQNVWQRYRKPIWVTELALIDHDNGPPSYPPLWQQAAFVKGATRLLTSMSYVERYAWFALPNTRGNGTGLMNDDGTPTEPGREFQKAPRTR